jgi:hypothetical protein
VLCDYRVGDKFVYLFSFCAHQVKRHGICDRNSAVDSFGGGPGTVIDFELALFFVPIGAKVTGTISHCGLVLYLSLFRGVLSQPFAHLVYHSDESYILFSGRLDSVFSFECRDLSALPQAVGLTKVQVIAVVGVDFIKGDLPA